MLSSELLSVCSEEVFASTDSAAHLNCAVNLACKGSASSAATALDSKQILRKNLKEGVSLEQKLQLLLLQCQMPVLLQTV